jgi:5'-deoxynucleotidase YfbR-like HD superfamily hydrolase
MMKLQKLEAQLAAGKIARYHMLPIIGTQNVGEHSYGVAQVLRYIAGDALTTNMLLAALDHDVAELATGDVPFTAKREHPALKIALDTISAEYDASVGIAHELSEYEWRMVKWADLIEMGFFGVHQHRLGNKHGLTVVTNVLDALASSGASGMAINLINLLEAYLVSQR